MANRTQTAIGLLMLAEGLVACGGSRSSIPSAPTPTPASVALKIFTDGASGFSTSDLRDADEQIVQFNTAGELIWTADGTHIPGYSAQGNVIPAEASCRCGLVVRFGTSAGQRRAYLTADYGHDNPGTLVDLAIAGSVLVVKRTNMFAPGTYTQFGVVTEMTERGQAPVENAVVSRVDEEGTGWQGATTDTNGFYEIHGLYDGSRKVAVSKEGYEIANWVVAIHNDTRFDALVVRR